MTKSVGNSDAIIMAGVFNSIMVVYGAHHIEPYLAGSTIAEIERACRKELNLGDRCDAYCNGELVAGTDAVRAKAGDRIEFLRPFPGEAGRKRRHR